jgi:hypothetical protein
MDLGDRDQAVDPVKPLNVLTGVMGAYQKTVDMLLDFCYWHSPEHSRALMSASSWCWHLLSSTGRHMTEVH